VRGLQDLKIDLKELSEKIKGLGSIYLRCADELSEECKSLNELKPVILPHKDVKFP